MSLILCTVDASMDIVAEKFRQKLPFGLFDKLVGFGFQIYHTCNETSSHVARAYLLYAIRHSFPFVVSSQHKRLYVLIPMLVPISGIIDQIRNAEARYYPLAMALVLVDFVRKAMAADMNVRYDVNSFYLLPDSKIWFLQDCIAADTANSEKYTVMQIGTLILYLHAEPISIVHAILLRPTPKAIPALTQSIRREEYTPEVVSMLTELLVSMLRGEVTMQQVEQTLELLRDMLGQPETLQCQKLDQEDPIEGFYDEVYLRRVYEDVMLGIPKLRTVERSPRSR